MWYRFMSMIRSKLCLFTINWNSFPLQFFFFNFNFEWQAYFKLMSLTITNCMCFTDSCPWSEWNSICSHGWTGSISVSSYVLCNYIEGGVYNFFCLLYTELQEEDDKYNCLTFLSPIDPPDAGIKTMTKQLVGSN